MDRRHYEPRSAEEIAREFPGWSVERGTDQLWHAQRAQPLAQVRGEDLADLRDEMIRWIWNHDPPGTP
jgi:hypothetical protein